MRLVEHSLHAYRLRYERPVTWSDIVEDAAPFVLLRLVSDDGAVGVSEITVKPTWCGFTPRSLIAAIEDIFIPLLRTLDLSDPMQVRRALDRIPENLAAKALIDNACWDLSAARDGRPLWQQWGGVQHVALSFAVTRQPPQAMAREAETMVDRHGFRTIKVKGGQGLATDISGIREIRRAVGDAVTLYVDANGAYPLEQAFDYATAVADAGVAVLEDPCPLDPDSEFARLRAHCPIPLLVDFGCWYLRDANLFVAQGAQALSTKPGRFGLSDCRLMQQGVEQAGGRVVAGLMGESTLGTVAGLQFAAAVRDPLLPAELTWFHAMTDRITNLQPQIVDGAMALPDTPSVASLVDWAAVERLSL